MCVPSVTGVNEFYVLSTHQRPIIICLDIDRFDALQLDNYTLQVSHNKVYT